MALLRFDGKYATESDCTEMENLTNEIEMLVTIYFPEFLPLSHRMCKAYVLTLGGEPHSKLTGELRGLEQDLMSYWSDTKYVLSKERPLPEL